MQAVQPSSTVSKENVAKTLRSLFNANHPNFAQNPRSIDVLGLPVSSNVIQTLKETLGESNGSQSAIYIDAACVRFSNPNWDAAVHHTAHTMFVALGLIGADSSKIEVKLQSLHIAPAGSRIEYARDDDANLLATLLFVLPTAHEGGTVSVKPGHEVATMSTSFGSAYDATCLCWYSNALVDHGLVTSGAQVSLRYGLFHAGPGPVPIMFNPQPFADRTAQTFDIWIKKRNEENCPQRLYYVVTDKETYGNGVIQSVTFKDLQDPDFAFINLIHELAKKPGITVILGQLKQEQHGTPYSPHRVKQDYDGSDEEDDVERYEDTAELRKGDVEDVLWHFTPFLPDGTQEEEEELWEADSELLFKHDYLLGTVPDDVEWEGWQREDTRMMNLSYRLGLRLDLPPVEGSGESLKRKEPPFDEEAKIVELERQMKLFDDAAAGGHHN